jgi:hypothetical protein
MREKELEVAGEGGGSVYNYNFSDKMWNMSCDQVMGLYLPKVAESH